MPPLSESSDETSDSIYVRALSKHKCPSHFSAAHLAAAEAALRFISKEPKSNKFVAHTKEHLGDGCLRDPGWHLSPPLLASPP
jgi:hypothetical protein